jgi:ADP-heptose:LPS heptosyltransferase
MNKPILILQMQRMGDLVLTFPLLVWLLRRYPGRPLWVVAEKTFYEGLMKVSPPQVTYFPWEGLEVLRRNTYHLVVNLSHRTKAAELAGELDAEAKIGPVAAPGGGRYILGDWQLYRASLTASNRHNRFHWADLNALDLVDQPTMAATRWPGPRGAGPDARGVGLFIGASEPHKRPSAGFWGSLVRELVRRDLRPVLFGGPAEKPLAAEIGRLAPKMAMDFTASLGLDELARALTRMSLLVTPDTGPMHLAAWTGCRVLNLSMGPVHSWETGPYQPGNHVLSPSASCVGCWACDHDPPPCREAFSPSRTAFLVHLLVRGGSGLEGVRPPGQRLLVTGRTPHGLYDLADLDPGRRPSAPDDLGRLWRAFFANLFGVHDRQPVQEAWQALDRHHPSLTQVFRGCLASLGRELRKGITGELAQDFWKSPKPLIRPLSSYLHLYMENHDYSRQARANSLKILEKLIDLTA